MTVCGTGGWTGPLPGDPDNNVVLTATPAFGGIYVNWTYPMTNSHAVAHTLLYRGITNNFGSAVQRQVVSGDFFYDMIPTGITYYYWIKIVSINGTVGVTIGPASATARLMVDDLIEQLTGQIDQDVLATSLKGTLDNISIVNGNLAAEIFDREGGDTSLAAALADVAAGVADANTFITTEISSRVTADSAIAEQISLVAVTAGADLAAVQVTMDAWIGDVGVLEEKVSDIGALYTAKLTVNGLVGGFGLYNDGSTVQAGFDVDTFWIGRTSADKRKPFIIEGGVVYIDNAMINQLSADRIDTRGLTIKNILGEVIFGSGTALDWSNIGGAGKAANNATRNVFRGDWTTATVYEAGDIVMEAGYGWSVLSGHTSSAVVRPPVYPVSSNAFWTLYTVKGDTGLPGINGTRTAILDMYRNSVAAPTTFPVGNSTYTWSTGQFTDPGTLNSWARVPPAPVVGQDLWVVRQLYSDNNATATSVVGWAADTSRISAASGEPGADGVNGSRTGFLEVYQWAAATPTVFPAGTSTYTWATGAFTAPSTPNNWSITPGAQAPGETLWACSVRLTNNTTVTTDSVNWSGVSAAYAIGAAGSNGANAKTVTISASSQVFQINKALAVSPASITLTAYGQNLTGSPVFAVTSGTATLSGTGNTRALAYAGLTTDTATIQVTWDSQVDTITVAKIREGADGLYALAGVLSNESHTVPTDAAGNGGNFAGCSTVMDIFNGPVLDSANWTVTATPGTGITGSLTTRTYTVTALAGVDTSYVDLTASRATYPNIVKRFTITKSRTGVTGTAATAYWMMRSAAAVSKSLAGVMTPSVVTFSALSQTGVSAPAAYAGKFVIANSTDGTTFSDVYASVTNESSKAYTILGAAKAVRIRFYLDVGAGASTLLDEEVIPVVSDGPTGNTGLDGLTVVLSNEAHTLPAGNDGVIATYANSGTTVTVYEGTTALTASASAVVSAFRIGTITQSPLSTITPGGISYATTVGTVANHGGMATGTDSVSLTLPITIYRANGTSVVVNKVQTLTKSKTGAVGATGTGGLTGVLSNEAHVLPAATDGTVSAPGYVGSGTQIRVYEGATELQYDGSGLSNGTWTMSSVATNITRGGLTDLGSYLVVADHSGVAAGVDASSIVYTLTGKSSTGVSFTITRLQSFSKSKTGAGGSTGPAGPVVVLTSDRPTTFTATDGVLDAAQADLIFTATTQGLSGPTFAWTFSGLQSNPTASTTGTQTVTAAQFGTSKSAIVTCTVNSAYVDKMTVVRLEKSTAAAGATVGAPAGTFVNGIAVATLTTAVSNFNLSNDRKNTAVVVPTIPVTLAVEHVIQTDGSADISFDWLWAGSEGDIDGFIVYVRQSASSAAYTFGTTVAEETAYNVPANKRAFIVFGTAANKYYTFGVQAYRKVDADIDASGIIKSALVKVTTVGMDPYLPSASVTYSGDIVGTINGTTSSTVVSNASSAMTALADIASDSKLTPVEKQATKLEWATIYGEKAGINAAATAQGITTENTTYNTEFQALGDYLNGGIAYTISTTHPSWINGTDLANTTDIVGSTFRTRWAAVYTARQALLNKIAEIAATKATWATVSGTGRPADYASSGVSLIAGTGMVLSANGASRTAAVDAWDAHVYSKDGFAGGAYATARPVTNNRALMFGLNADPLLNTSYTSLDYAISCKTDGTLEAWKNNVMQSSLGAYTSSDLLSVSYDGSAVRWIKNGVTLLSQAVTDTNVLCFDSSFFTRFAGLADIQFGPYGNPSAIQASNPITSANVGTFIADAAISNTQIGGTIMSTDFVSGSAGWAINKAGAAELNNATFRGQINVGAYNGYAWPAAGGTGAHLSSLGLLLGNANASAGNPGGKYFQVYTPVGGTPYIDTNIPAYLADLQVSTVKIAGQAVTIPISVFTAGTVTVTTGSYTNVQSLSITSTGAPIAIFANAECVGSTWRLRRGAGTILYTSSYLTNASFSAVVTETPGAGVHTYYIDVLTLASAPDNVAKNRSIFLLETKK